MSQSHSYITIESKSKAHLFVYLIFFMEEILTKFL